MIIFAIIETYHFLFSTFSSGKETEDSRSDWREEVFFSFHVQWSVILLWWPSCRRIKFVNLSQSILSANENNTLSATRHETISSTETVTPSVIFRSLSSFPTFQEKHSLQIDMKFQSTKLHKIRKEQSSPEMLSTLSLSKFSSVYNYVMHCQILLKESKFFAVVFEEFSCLPTISLQFAVILEFKLWFSFPQMLFLCPFV